MRIGEIHHHLLASRLELIEDRLRVQEKAIIQMDKQHRKDVDEIKGAMNKILSILERNDKDSNSNQVPSSTQDSKIEEETNFLDQNIKIEPNENYFHLSGSPITVPVTSVYLRQQDGNDEVEEENEALDESVRVLQFLDLTRDQEYAKVQYQRRNRMVAQLQSENELKQEPLPFSVKDKKNLLKYMKSRMSETVVGPPKSQTKFQDLYPEAGPWTPDMTRLSDFSGAARRNTIKNGMDGDLSPIAEENENTKKRSRNKPKQKVVHDEDEDVTPKAKRFKPNSQMKKVGRKFSKFDDDSHQFMAQEERESRYVDEVFDSDSDSDGFEPKPKKPKKKVAKKLPSESE